eukprot:6767873-Prymnesium_polylepis.2
MGYARGRRGADCRLRIHASLQRLVEARLCRSCGRDLVARHLVQAPIRVLRPFPMPVVTAALLVVEPNLHARLDIFLGHEPHLAAQMAEPPPTHRKSRTSVGLRGRVRCPNCHLRAEVRAQHGVCESSTGPGLGKRVVQKEGARSLQNGDSPMKSCVPETTSVYSPCINCSRGNHGPSYCAMSSRREAGAQRRWLKSIGDAVMVTSLRRRGPLNPASSPCPALSRARANKPMPCSEGAAKHQLFMGPYAVAVSIAAVLSAVRRSTSRRGTLLMYASSSGEASCFHNLQRPSAHHHRWRFDTHCAGCPHSHSGVSEAGGGERSKSHELASHHQRPRSQTASTPQSHNGGGAGGGRTESVTHGTSAWLSSPTRSKRRSMLVASQSRPRFGCADFGAGADGSDGAGLRVPLAGFDCFADGFFDWGSCNGSRHGSDERFRFKRCGRLVLGRLAPCSMRTPCSFAHSGCAEDDVRSAVATAAAAAFASSK